MCYTFGTHAGVRPLEIIVTDLRKELSSGLQKDRLRIRLRSGRRAWPNVQPSVRARAEMDAFRAGVRRHGRIDQCADTPPFDATVQLVVVAADEVHVVLRPPGHF